MTEGVDRVASDLEQLKERVLELEHRVAALEGHPEEFSTSQPVFLDIAIERSRPPETWQGFPPADLPTGTVPVLGKAILGIAGAYLLRAISESGLIPKMPVLVVAVLYAGLWMVWAAQTKVNRFASFTYAINSALILSPLLWECTVRFQVLSPPYTGMILSAFVVFAAALDWRRNMLWIPSVAVVAAVITAGGLILATHELVPFTIALLGMSLTAEIVVCLSHPFLLRAVPAIATDIAFWLLLDLTAVPDKVPESYHLTPPIVLIAVGFALLVTYAGSVGIRGFWLHQKLTILDVGQIALTSLLAGFGAIRLDQSWTALALGALFLLASGFCYWGALSRFSAASQVRNRSIAASFAAVLLAASSRLLFQPALQVLFLCLSAIAAALIYAHTAQVSLGVHASLYLVVAAALSPIPTYLVHAFAGSVPGAPDWLSFVVASSAALCYFVGSGRPKERVGRRTFWVLPAVLVGFGCAALAISVMVWFAAGHVELTPSRLSVIRTVVNCALALAFGYLGYRWKRLELVWSAYTAVGFGTMKLLFEDLRFGNAASLVVSLLFYGSILIVLPRLTRRNRGESLLS